MAITVAATLPVVVGFTALGVDASYVYWHRTKLQETANAAALAGSSLLPDSTAAQTAAIAYAQTNMPTGKYGNVLVAADAVSGTWNPSTRVFTSGGANRSAMRVTLRSSTANSNPVRLFFAGIFGYSQMNITASATATFGSYKSWDVIIVQDVTASFSQEIADARTADQTLLSCLKNSMNATSQVGLTTFTGSSQTQRALTAMDTVISAGPPQVKGYDALTTKISQLDYCGTGSPMPSCSGTNIAAGLNAAVSQFTTGYTAGTDSSGKAIILVSDGAPQVNAGMGNYSGTCPSCTDAKLATLATNAANAANAAGVVVHTVYFDRDNNATDRAFLASLARGTGAKALSTPTASQLSSLVFEICATIPRRLVD